MPVGPFFADFLCRETRLVIELDGFSHDLEPERDASRGRWIAREGYTVLRFATRRCTAISKTWSPRSARRSRDVTSDAPK